MTASAASSSRTMTMTQGALPTTLRLRVSPWEALLQKVRAAGVNTDESHKPATAKERAQLLSEWMKAGYCKAEIAEFLEIDIDAAIWVESFQMPSLDERIEGLFLRLLALPQFAKEREKIQQCREVSDRPNGKSRALTLLSLAVLKKVDAQEEQKEVESLLSEFPQEVVQKQRDLTSKLVQIRKSTQRAIAYGGMRLEQLTAQHASIQEHVALTGEANGQYQAELQMHLDALAPAIDVLSHQIDRAQVELTQRGDELLECKEGIDKIETLRKKNQSEIDQA